MLKKIASISLSVIVLISCGPKNEFDPKDGIDSFTKEGLEQHIKVLASDDYQGRRPFTEGEKKTITYLETKFREIGLEPGNGISYLQEVPMVEITSTVDSVMTVKGTKTKTKLSG